MNVPEYNELRVTFRPGRDGVFEVDAKGSNGGVARGSFTRLDDAALREFLRNAFDYINFRKRGRPGMRGASDARLDAEGMGAALFNGLFTGEMDTLYHRCLDASREQKRCLRITLDLTNTPPLGDLPWELLYHRPRFLSSTTNYSVVRYLELGVEPRPLLVEPPLRILGVLSNPSDLGFLDVEREREGLEEALTELIDSGYVELSWAPRATGPEIHKHMSRMQPHVFHFIGHGRFEEEARSGQLYLEGADGRAAGWTGNRLGQILGEGSLRLAVLNACDGARSPGDDAFSGVASSLIEHEVPAVVGMQFEITDEAAIIFARSFYEGIADNLPVDGAVTRARTELFAYDNNLEWATPVLFMRAKDGRIFDMKAGTDERARREPRREPTGERRMEKPAVTAIEPPPELESAETNGKGYSGAVEQRDQLVALIERQAALAAEIGLESDDDTLATLREKVSSERFRVLVLGDFNRGKSTVINALLRAHALPTGIEPTTALLTEVRWGERRRVLLHPPGDNGSEPTEINVEDLLDEVVIGNREERHRRWDRAELQWPLRLCEHGVEIIDSPGLNEDEGRESLVTNYLGQVDAVLFVMECRQLATKEEVALITGDLRQAGHEDLFFLLNFKNDVREREWPGLRERIKRVAQLTHRGDAGIFLVDAYGALEAHLHGDAAALEGTGMPEVEAALERFLTIERQRIKLLPPTRVLHRIACELHDRVLPERARALAVAPEAMERRIREAKTELQAIEADRDALAASLEARLKGVVRDAATATRAFNLELASEVPDRVDDFEPTSKFKILDSKASANAIAEEIGEHVAGEAEAASRRWYDDTLQPMLTERLNAVVVETERDMARLLSRLDGLRATLFAAVDGGPAAKPKRTPTKELALAEPQALVGAGAGSIDLSDVKARIGGPAALAGGALVLAAAIPISLVLLAPAISQILKRRTQAGDQIKNLVGKELSRAMREAAGERADKVATAVGQQCDEVKTAAMTWLERQVAQASDQIDAAIKTQREEAEEREREREALEETASRCRVLLTDLDAFTDELTTA
jgi:GTPase SAR1 family protein